MYFLTQFEIHFDICCRVELLAEIARPEIVAFTVYKNKQHLSVTASRLST